MRYEQKLKWINEHKILMWFALKFLKIFLLSLYCFPFSYHASSMAHLLYRHMPGSIWNQYAQGLQ